MSVSMSVRKENTIIGVDLGGTKILAARILGNKIIKTHQVKVPKNGSKSQVLNSLYETIDNVMSEDVVGIGIGVPSVVDVAQGIVYDVQNIKSWDVVPVGKLLEERYKVTIQVNNDANCFALGEKYFGKAMSYEDIAAVITGTGMAAGLIINGKLFNGANCGAGEFGMIPYKEHNFEYYASGQFFENCYNTTGEQVSKRASEGDIEAIKIYKEYGSHLGKAIKAILYAIDPQIIILGGSVSKSFEFYRDELYSEIQSFAYRPTIENIRIEVSEKPNIAVLGAAALMLDLDDLEIYSQVNKPVI